MVLFYTLMPFKMNRRKVGESRRYDGTRTRVLLDPRYLPPRDARGQGKDDSNLNALELGSPILLGYLMVCFFRAAWRLV